MPTPQLAVHFRHKFNMCNKERHMSCYADRVTDCDLTSSLRLDSENGQDLMLTKLVGVPHDIVRTFDLVARH